MRTATKLCDGTTLSSMHRSIGWVAFALLAWLALNALVCPFSYLIPEGATPMAEAGTPMQNFNMTLLIELIIVILFADVFRVRRLRNAPPAKGDSFKGGLVGTVVDYECPLFITALFLGIQIVVIHTIAF
jgi:hypothetical protein